MTAVLSQPVAGPGFESEAAEGRRERAVLGLGDQMDTWTINPDKHESRPQFSGFSVARTQLN